MAHVVEKRNMDRILVVKLKGMRLLVRIVCRELEDNIKWILNRMEGRLGGLRWLRIFTSFGLLQKQ